MKKIIISVTNDLTTDQRVHKVADSLYNHGFSVCLVGRSGDHMNPRNYQYVRFNMIFHHGFFFYLEFNIRLFFFLLFKNFDIVLSNDLDTLLANFFVSKIKRKQLVYDTHELFPEVPELINRPITRSVWLLIERFCLPRINDIYTVSASIAHYYYKKYSIEMSLIRNYPLYRKLNYTQSNENYKKIIYQGAVNKDRGVKLMIESMKHLENVKLYIVGGGDLLDVLMSYTKDLNLQNKVNFLGKIPFSKLHVITDNADLGLSFEEDTCLAYRYALPNKVFDYISSEIPILLSDLPEFKKIIQKYNVGMILKSRKPKDVADQITQILSINKSEFLSELKVAKKDFCWENEEKELLSFFT